MYKSIMNLLSKQSNINVQKCLYINNHLTMKTYLCNKWVAGGH